MSPSETYTGPPEGLKARKKHNMAHTTHQKKAGSRVRPMVRSSSHNKLTRLSTSSSGPTIVLRPNLNRSKSTDSVNRPLSRLNLTRNNRLMGLLTGLQPLTKTTLGPLLTTNRSSGSLKGMAPASGGIRTSTRKGRAILRLNEDNEDYEDINTENADGEDEDKSNEISEINGPQGNDNEARQHNSQEDGQDSRSGSQISILVEPRSQSDVSVPSEPPTESQSELDVESRKSQEQSQEEFNKSEVLQNKDVNSVLVGQADAPADAQPNAQANAQASDFIKQNYATATGERSELGEKQNNDSKSAQTNQESRNVLELDRPTSGALASSEDFRSESAAPLGGSVSSNLYGGSLLLSQLTGLTKKVDHAHPYTAVAPTSLENMSGISFKANPIESTNYHNLAEPVISGKNAVTPSSYQPEQTIYSNLQRTNSQYNAPRKQNMSLQNYLTSNNQSDHAHNIETRTQQRLWLQRENSLMDVAENHNFSSLSLNKLMFSHNYSLGNIKDLDNGAASVNSNTPNQQQSNGVPSDPGAASSSSISGLLRMLQSGHNSIQSRTEFERLNREYLNVRRHLNPVGESLSRLGKLKDEVEMPKKRQTKTNANGNANSFREFSPQTAEQEHEVSSQINRIWQQALLLSLASSSSVSTAPKQQRPTNQRASVNMRSPQTPTTRAVKLKQRAS